MRIKVLGIDPSMQNFGLAVAVVDVETLDFDVVDLKLVTSQSDKVNKKVVRKNSDDLRRARHLHRGLREALIGAAFGFVEIPVGSQSARAMASYGMCLGILASFDTPLIEVTPSEVKMAAVGDNTAAKEEMIRWASERFPKAPWLVAKRAGKFVLVNKNEHLADAVAAIAAGVQTQQFKEAIALYKAMRFSPIAA